MGLANMKKVRRKKKVDLISLSKNNRRTIKFTMNIPEDIHIKFKVAISKEGKNMTDVMLKFVNAYIKGLRI